MSRAIASLAAALLLGPGAASAQPYARPVPAAEAAPPASTGATVLASGDGFTITVDDYLAALGEQAEATRARFSTAEKRREFLDNLIRFELLVVEARRQGLDRDPRVLRTMEKVIVQRLVQDRFAGPGDRAEKTKAFDAWAAQLRAAADVKVNADGLRALPLDAKVAPAPEASAAETSTPP